jgi:hypothetical protein
MEEAEGQWLFASSGGDAGVEDGGCGGVGGNRDLNVTSVGIDTGGVSGGHVGTVEMVKMKKKIVRLMPPATKSVWPKASQTRMGWKKGKDVGSV